MSHRMLIGLTLCALVLTAAPTIAGPMVTLSSPDSLSDLAIGQTVEIDVTLSGLSVNTDFIFNLNTKVLFPTSVFEARPDPTSSSGLTALVAPGSVFYNFVQGPLQIANFNAQSSLVAGAAIGIFSESPNTDSGAIGLNGLYYSFDLTVIAYGSGSILFDPAPGANEYAADDTGFNYAPLPISGALEFNIISVPEPSAVGMLALGMAALGCWTRVRSKVTA